MLENKTKTGIQANIFELAHIRLAQQNKRNIDDIEITEELINMAEVIRKKLDIMIRNKKVASNRYCSGVSNMVYL